MTTSTRGRPHASSREVLADAACELFLEQGYDATSVAEITRRAGVSRSSFFNYFESKSGLLWFVFDAHTGALVDALEGSRATLDEALAAFGRGEPPETLALAIVDARTMRVEEELLAGRAARQSRIAAAIAARLEREGESPVRAEIRAAGYAAALIGAVWRWALQGAGRHPLHGAVAESLGAAAEVLSGEGSRPY
ncbi:TetR/AcrR family transcriptional regulator [Leucobacter ruminantium]|uniref:TetR family transcriptional regulator n=1 Tax=Leucobacter ruminantium TaxID=1289170 RepID=A0A939LYV4_9MICO|nr:TetR/AcrR family transcriptional regulator [Leucobacter ruminantium]MBO1804932.1 TetR family transcriptional regulator [Leucobacter ruminantium]